MLNGIGGRTIEEAQERISSAEWKTWMKYRHKRGSLHPGIRIEWAAALQASMFANANTKNGGYSIYDFAPHIDEPAMTLEDAMKVWR